MLRTTLETKFMYINTDLSTSYHQNRAAFNMVGIIYGPWKMCINMTLTVLELSGCSLYAHTWFNTCELCLSWIESTISKCSKVILYR